MTAPLRWLRTVTVCVTVPRSGLLVSRVAVVSRTTWTVSPNFTAPTNFVVNYSSAMVVPANHPAWLTRPLKIATTSKPWAMRPLKGVD